MVQSDFLILQRRKLRPRKIIQLTRSGRKLEPSISRFFAPMVHSLSVVSMSIGRLLRGCWFCGVGPRDQDNLKDGTP